MIRLACLVPALLLGGCVIVPVPLPKVAGTVECRNDGLEQYVGQQPTQQMGAEMLRTSGAKTLQWIGHDTMVTMDFRSDRLRVRLGPDGRIQSARCG